MKPEEMIKDIERLYGSSADDFINGSRTARTQIARRG